MRETALLEGVHESTHVEGATFPAVERAPRSERQIRTPREVKTARRPRLLREPSPPAAPAHADDKDPHDNRDPVVFHTYRPSDTLTKTLTNAADPSGAASESRVVLMSGNWFCDVSTDDGSTWKRLDPTTIFPNSFAGGFCCDQIVIYVPSIDTYVWLLQYAKDSTGQGAFRIARASSGSIAKDPTSWTYWDFVAGDFGYAASDMDYPDLAFSNNFLYMSTDVFAANGRLVVRIPLKDLQAGGTINYTYTDPAKSTTAWGAHLVQHTSTQAVWVGQRDNATVEVFTMPDTGNTYSSVTIPVASWPNGTMTSTGPDGNDWLTKLRSFPAFAVTGGVERANGNIVIAWAASNGSGSANGFNFPNTHCRVAELDLAGKKTVSEMQVWNTDYAFAYPMLARNANDDIGIILGWGGSKNHANCATGIVGDFVVWFHDGSTRTVQRFGDFLTTRPSPHNTLLFSAFGYWVTEVTADPSQCVYNPFYAEYGRSSA